MATKSAQRQFLVKVSGIDGYFSTKSGGNISSDTNKHFDGGATIPDVLASPAQAENISVSRAYDVSVDPDRLATLRQKVGRWRTTISVTPTDEDLIATGTPVVYPEALLVGMTEPDYDSSGGDVATWELEFAIGAYR